MFNDKIRELMNTRGISQRDLAKAIHINESAMSRYISGERTPRIDILTKLARFFDVSIEELIDEKSENSNC